MSIYVYSVLEHARRFLRAISKLAPKKWRTVAGTLPPKITTQKELLLLLLLFYI